MRDTMISKKIQRWSIPPTERDGKTITEESTIDIILYCLNNEVQQITGMEHFTQMQRIAAAINKAKDTIELDTADYDYIVSVLKSSIPATWAFNDDISNAVNNFLEVKS